MTGGLRHCSPLRWVLEPALGRRLARAWMRRCCSSMRRGPWPARRRTRMLGIGSSGLSPVRMEDPQRGRPGKHTGGWLAALVEEGAALTLQESAVTCLPQPFLAVHDDLPATQDKIGAPSQGLSLIARVIH